MISAVLRWLRLSISPISVFHRDKSDRKEIYGETQRLTPKYLPFIYLVNPLDVVAVRDRIQGVKFSALGSQGATLWNKYELKMSK